jgi:hypothetical protein
MQAVIEEVCRSMAKTAIADLISEIQRRCDALNVPTPSTSTIRRRLKMMARERQAPMEAGKPANGSRGQAPRQEMELHLLRALYDSAGKKDGWDTFIDVLTQSYGGGKGVLAIHDAAPTEAGRRPAANGRRASRLRTTTTTSAPIRGFPI